MAQFRRYVHYAVTVVGSMIFLASTATTLGEQEAQIQMLFQLVLFTIPLLTAVAIAVAYAIIRVRQAIAQVQLNHASISEVLAPSLATMQKQLSGIHTDVTELKNGKGTGTDPATTAE